MQVLKTTKITFRNKEVEHPLLRALVVVAAVVLIPIGIVLGLIASIVLLPLSIPVHLLLIAVGRKGFAESTDRGSFSYNVSPEGFRKA